VTGAVELGRVASGISCPRVAMLEGEHGVCDAVDDECGRGDRGKRCVRGPIVCEQVVVSPCGEIARA
jgi:hypothetical protein